MARVRVSTTVDRDLLEAARAAHGGPTDSSLLEAALAELLARHRRVQVDAEYVGAYREQPVDAPDAWGDLKAWQSAAAQARRP